MIRLLVMASMASDLFVGAWPKEVPSRTANSLSLRQRRAAVL